jgi:hypothetical protein
MNNEQINVSKPAFSLWGFILVVFSFISAFVSTYYFETKLFSGNGFSIFDTTLISLLCSSIVFTILDKIYVNIESKKSTDGKNKFTLPVLKGLAVYNLIFAIVFLLLFIMNSSCGGTGRIMC